MIACKRCRYVYFSARRGALVPRVPISDFGKKLAVSWEKRRRKRWWWRRRTRSTFSFYTVSVNDARCCAQVGVSASARVGEVSRGSRTADEVYRQRDKSIDDDVENVFHGFSECCAKGDAMPVARARAMFAGANSRELRVIAISRRFHGGGAVNYVTRWNLAYLIISTRFNVAARPAE